MPENQNPWHINFLITYSLPTTMPSEPNDDNNNNRNNNNNNNNSSNKSSQLKSHNYGGNTTTTNTTATNRSSSSFYFGDDILTPYRHHTTTQPELSSSSHHHHVTYPPPGIIMSHSIEDNRSRRPIISNSSSSNPITGTTTTGDGRQQGFASTGDKIHHPPSDRSSYLSSLQQHSYGFSSMRRPPPTTTALCSILMEQDTTITGGGGSSRRTTTYHQSILPPPPTGGGYLRLSSSTGSQSSPSIVVADVGGAGNTTTHESVTAAAGGGSSSSSMLLGLGGGGGRHDDRDKENQSHSQPSPLLPSSSLPPSSHHHPPLLSSTVVAVAPLDSSSSVRLATSFSGTTLPSSSSYHRSAAAPLASSSSRGTTYPSFSLSSSGSRPTTAPPHQQPQHHISTPSLIDDNSSSRGLLLLRQQPQQQRLRRRSSSSASDQSSSIFRTDDSQVVVSTFDDTTTPQHGLAASSSSHDEIATAVVQQPLEGDANSVTISASDAPSSAGPPPQQHGGDHHESIIINRFLRLSLPEVRIVTTTATGGSTTTEQQRYCQYKVEVVVDNSTIPSQQQQQQSGGGGGVVMEGDDRSGVIEGLRPKHVVWRNYSSFQKLHDEIVSLLSPSSGNTISLPTLPPPLSIPPTLSYIIPPTQLDQHRLKLEQYLSQIIKSSQQYLQNPNNPHLSITKNPIWEFLDNDSCALLMHLKYAVLETRMADLTQTCLALRTDQAQAELTIANSRKIIDSLQERVRSLERGDQLLQRTLSESSLRTAATTSTATDGPIIQQRLSRTDNIYETRPTTAPPPSLHHQQLSQHVDPYLLPSSSRSYTPCDDAASHSMESMGSSSSRRPLSTSGGVGVHSSLPSPASFLRGGDSQQQQQQHSSEGGGQRGMRFGQPLGITSGDTPPTTTTNLYGTTTTSNTTGRTTAWDLFPQQQQQHPPPPPLHPPPRDANSNNFPWDIIASYTTTTIIDEYAETILGLIMANQEASSHRDSILKYLSHQIKQSIDAQCFSIGCGAIRSFLPDDRIELTAITSLERESLFFVDMHELLSNQHVVSLEQQKPEGMMAGMTAGDGSSLRCKIGGVGLDITVNNLARLCEAAFLEHIDRLLGRQHLFKRSLLLLKAWWMYESISCSSLGDPTGSGASASDSGVGAADSLCPQLLSDYALAIMLVAVINRCHRQLRYPMQVLAAFLSTYNNFNWKTHCVSIEETFLPIEFLSLRQQGVSTSAAAASVAASGGGGSISTSDYLIPTEVLHQYRQKYASPSVTRSGHGDHHHPVHKPIPSSTTNPSSTATTTAGKSYSSAASSGTTQTTSFTTNPQQQQAQQQSPLSSSNTSFGIGYMNVINPLNERQNLVGRAIVTSERHLEIIQKMIDDGAKDLHFLFVAVRGASAETEVEEEMTVAKKGMQGDGGLLQQRYRTIRANLERFFSNTLQRFSSGWRPDLPSPSSTPLSTLSGIRPFANCDLLDGDYQQLWENFTFSSFLLEYEMTTTALTNLATAVLAERGPMPVGEVGKMLQEASANPNLSQLLKEQFNGLKKFLEKFPDIFLISNDHPFNPHVYLRSGFTEDEQRMIEAGSTAFMSTQKKTKKVRRKGKGNIAHGGGHQFHPPGSPPFPHR